MFVCLATLCFVSFQIPSTPLKMSAAAAVAKRILPLFDRVLVQVLINPETSGSLKTFCTVKGCFSPDITRDRFSDLYELNILLLKQRVIPFIMKWGL